MASRWPRPRRSRQASTRACSTWSIRARCSSGPLALRGSEAASAVRTRRRSADVGLSGEWRGPINYRRVAPFTGWLWIITFLTSIPARLFFYAPVLDHEGNYVTGAGTDARTLIGLGALLELLLILSNVGTAVVPYSIHKRVHEAGAVAYVTARLVECTFIAIGIV